MVCGIYQIVFLIKLYLKLVVLIVNWLLKVTERIEKTILENKTRKKLKMKPALTSNEFKPLGGGIKATKLKKKTIWEKLEWIYKMNFIRLNAKYTTFKIFHVDYPSPSNNQSGSSSDSEAQMEVEYDVNNPEMLHNHVGTNSDSGTENGHESDEVVSIEEEDNDVAEEPVAEAVPNPSNIPSSPIDESTSSSGEGQDQSDHAGYAADVECHTHSSEEDLDPYSGLPNTYDKNRPLYQVRYFTRKDVESALRRAQEALTTVSASKIQIPESHIIDFNRILENFFRNLFACPEIKRPLASSDSDEASENKGKSKLASKSTEGGAAKKRPCEDEGPTPKRQQVCRFQYYTETDQPGPSSRDDCTQSSKSNEAKNQSERDNPIVNDPSNEIASNVAQESLPESMQQEATTSEQVRTPCEHHRRNWLIIKLLQQRDTVLLPDDFSCQEHHSQFSDINCSHCRMVLIALHLAHNARSPTAHDVSGEQTDQPPCPVCMRAFEHYRGLFERTGHFPCPKCTPWLMRLMERVHYQSYECEPLDLSLQAMGQNVPSLDLNQFPTTIQIIEAPPIIPMTDIDIPGDQPRDILKVENVTSSGDGELRIISSMVEVSTPDVIMEEPMQSEVASEVAENLSQEPQIDVPRYVPPGLPHPLEDPDYFPSDVENTLNDPELFPLGMEIFLNPLTSQKPTSPLPDSENKNLPQGSGSPHNVTKCLATEFENLVDVGTSPKGSESPIDQSNFPQEAENPLIDFKSLPTGPESPMDLSNFPQEAENPLVDFKNLPTGPESPMDLSNLAQRAGDRINDFRTLPNGSESPTDLSNLPQAGDPIGDLPNLPLEPGDPIIDGNNLTTGPESPISDLPNLPLGPGDPISDPDYEPPVSSNEAKYVQSPDENKSSSVEAEMSHLSTTDDDTDEFFESENVYSDDNLDKYR